MLEVISVEILNFLNFGDDEEDEKQLVGLRQDSGRRQKVLMLRQIALRANIEGAE